MSENGTAANIPVSENVSATVENNSTVSTRDLQHSASTDSCSLAFLGISYFFITNVADKLSPMWVVASGVTSYETSLSYLFISYSLCPSYKKITIADGSVITDTGQGDIPLEKSVILKRCPSYPKVMCKSHFYAETHQRFQMPSNFLPFILLISGTEHERDDWAC